MRNQLHIKLVPHKLDKPRLECQHASCSVSRDDGEGNVIYESGSICHDPCYQVAPSGHVSSYIKGPFCEIFIEGFCKICHHPWRNHTYTQYEYREKLVPRTDAILKATLKNLAIESAEVQRRIDEVEAAIYKGSDEEKAMLRSNLTQTDSITPYGDANFKYLDYLIQKEIEKAENIW